MWNISSREIRQLVTPGGDRFTEFVDALIRAEAFLCRVPPSQIHTNLRTNVRDEGVDTEVKRAFRGDKTDWLSVKSCWQYKATSHSSLYPALLGREMSKRYSKHLICAGYGYRLCICDDLTPTKNSNWTKALARFANSFNRNAKPPIIVTASDLAAWANRFPPLVKRFFRPLASAGLPLTAFANIARTYTPRFVSIPDWIPITRAIHEHVDFTSSCPKAVLPLQGQAGVGKTRLVYEALATQAGIDAFVLYTLDDNDVLRIAQELSSDASLHAILVADECSLEIRGRLETLLHHCRKL